MEAQVLQVTNQTKKQQFDEHTLTQPREKEVLSVDTYPESKDTPILQGHVFKQSSQGIGSKIGMVSFKKRYFVLYDGVLMYYEHQSSYERDKQHGLNRGKKILLDDLYLTHSSVHNTSHCFTLHVPHKDNKRDSYVLAMSDRKSRNIWIEMLQQQNPQLEPPVSEIDGPPKPLPSYINIIRTLRTPSPILMVRPSTPTQIHITELENYHYLTWNGNGTLDFTSFQQPQSGLLKANRTTRDKGSLNSLCSDTFFLKGSIDSLDVEQKSV